jgi:hypothetical protein
VPRLFLDTTVLIDALRGRAAADRLRSLRPGTEPPFVCAINVEELWRGARTEEEAAIRRMLLALQIAPLGRDEGQRAGEWRREFAAKGVTLSQSDCLIAAAAIGVTARLVTGNPADFPMVGLTVEHWPVG